jgi:hypothetical protein
MPLRPHFVASVICALLACSFGLALAQAPLARFAAPAEMFTFGTEPESMVVIVTHDGLVIAGNDGDRALEALERTGVAEHSLAGEELMAPFERFEQEGASLGLAVRSDVLINPTLEALYALDLTLGPVTIDRLVDAFDTIESVAYRWSIVDSGPTKGGLVFESALTVDPDGPDQSLVDLLLCEGCRAARTYLAPAGAHVVASSSLPARELVDYLATWLDEGEGYLDEWLEREAGLDLNTDLLDWLGDDVHVVQLEPLGTDLRTLLYQPGQILMIPAASEEAALAGLERLEAAFADYLAAGQGRLEEAVPVSLREFEYEGVSYRRLQTSVNVDLGVAVVGNHLVVAAPAASLEPVIDTFQGSPAMVASEEYRVAMADVPTRSSSISYQSTGAQLRSLADIVRLVGQPLAFALDLAAFNDRGGSSWSAELDMKQRTGPFGAGAFV